MSTLPDYKTILYASDLGEHTRGVFRHAMSLARRYEGRIIMLHVVEPMGAAGRAVIDTYLPPERVMEIERDGMQRVLQTMKAKVEQAYAEELGESPTRSPLVSEVIVRSGRPAETIVRTAQEKRADLIVMGGCTHSIFGENLLGSTARHVIHHARLPVLVVPNNCPAP